MGLNQRSNKKFLGCVMSSDMSNVILYSYFQSSCSWRVRAFLAFKGIQYECRTINLLKMEHRDPEFLKINPNGQVPSLIYNGHVMSGSDTILEFLEETHPSVNPSLPSDLYQRQTVRQIYSLIGGFIQPLQNPFLAAKFANKYEAGNEEKIAFIKKDWMYSVIRDGFVALEKLLEQHSGKYCFGDSITMADFFLVPQVANAVRNGVELKEFPIINELNERLLQEECFKVSHPSVQPDAPKDS